MLFFYTVAGMAALTLILAAVFLTEGIVCIFTSFRMRDNPAWIWLLLNGIVALILGGMIFARWPGRCGLACRSPLRDPIHLQRFRHADGRTQDPQGLRRR